MLENVVKAETGKTRFKYTQHFDRIVEASKQIVTNATASGASEKDSLADITICNLQKYVPDLEPNEISRVLKKIYHRGDFGGNYEELRRTVATELFPYTAIISFDKTDLRNGFTHPKRITFPLTCILGVEITDMKKPDDTNKIKLCGTTDDERFYKDRLAPMINDTFSINIKTKIKDRERIKDEKTYTWKDVYIEFTSKDHIRFLQDIGFIDEYKNFRKLDFESINCIDHNRIRQHKESYIASIIAGGGHIGYKTDEKGVKYPKLEFKNKDITYLPELKRMHEELEIKAKYTTPPSKPYYLYFTEDNIKLLAKYEPLMKITPDQIGLFTNPKHLEFIRTLL